MIHTPYNTPTQAAKTREQFETNASIFPIVPDLCSKVNRKRSLDQYLTQLSRTRTIGCNHKAYVCIICDCFIIGVEKICWLSEQRLIAKKSYLSVSYLEATANKRIPIGLRNQYKIDNSLFYFSRHELV